MRIKAGNSMTSDGQVLEVIAAGGLSATLAENASGELDLTLSGGGFSLDSDIAAAATTATLAGSLANMQVGQLVAFGVGTSTCEVRRVTAIAGSVVTASAAFKWPHTAGQTVLPFTTYASPSWWGAVPSASVDSFRALSNMFLDSQQSGVAYDIYGAGYGSAPAYHSSRPLYFPDQTKLVNFSLMPYFPFALDCTQGIWTYDSWPHQHFAYSAGNFATVVAVDTAANTVKLSTSIGTVEGEPMSFYVREGLGTLPGGVEEGRTYYLKTTDSATQPTMTLSIDKWGASTVDITGGFSGEVCCFSPGLSRFNTDRVFIYGGMGAGGGINIPGLNGFYAHFQQPCTLKDFRVQAFAGFGMTVGAQQANMEALVCTSHGRGGIRLSSAEIMFLYGSNFEGSDINVELLDMSVGKPSGTAAYNGDNIGVFLSGLHFEGAGAGSHLVQTIQITGVPASGTFTLNGQTLNWNADSTAIQTACDSAFGAGNCAVTGGPLPGAQVTLTFQGIYQYGFGPIVTISNTNLVGGTYAVNTVNPNGRCVSLKGGSQVVLDGGTETSTTRPDGTSTPLLIVEGAAGGVNYWAYGGWEVDGIYSFSAGTGDLIQDPNRGNRKRSDNDPLSTSNQPVSILAPSRHGSGASRQIEWFGDGGRSMAWGANGVPILTLSGAASQTDPYYKVKMGTSPGANANPYEARDSTDALLYSVDNKGLVKPPASRPKLATPTYSASITPDASAGEWQTITVTNGSAFTINAPTSPPTAAQSQNLTIEVLNSSGGAMGVITWNAAYVFAAGAWTNPASTKKRYVTFRWNGASWIAGPPATTDY